MNKIVSWRDCSTSPFRSSTLLRPDPRHIIAAHKPCSELPSAHPHGDQSSLLPQVHELGPRKVHAGVRVGFHFGISPLVHIVFIAEYLVCNCL